MSIFAQTLQSGLAALNIEIDALAAQQLERHWRLVAVYRQKFNLTAIREEDEAALKHYVDCLLLLPLLQKIATTAQQAYNIAPAVDIGSGAGFPGLVLAITCPHSQWTLLESNGKKSAFLQLCIKELAIKNARVLTLRAEAAGQRADLRGYFSVATARAVAALPVLLEYALPLLAIGGSFIAAKGPALAEEEAAAATALAVLGAKPGARQSFTLPGGGQRFIACYHKTAMTPAAYPRRAGIPAKRPLG